MDSLVASFPAVADADLMLCQQHGVAYQRDMASRITYDDGYLPKVESYEGNAIAQAVNAGRCALVLRHLVVGSSVMDIGAGTGAFVREARSWGLEAFGYDVIPAAARNLQQGGLYADWREQRFDAVTLWDTIEHLERPELVLASVPIGSFVFVSVPVFGDLAAIRASRHYRPGEHLYYWTSAGFVQWMERRGFALAEISDHEVKAGRESIGAFAFCRTGR